MTRETCTCGFEGSCENFLQPVPPPSDGGARSSAGCAAAASFNLLTPQSIMGLTFVGAAGAAAQSVVNTAAAGAARGGRNADLQWKGKHSDNAFRLDPGHCHHLNDKVVCLILIHTIIQHTFLKHTRMQIHIHVLFDIYTRF